MACGVPVVASHGGSSPEIVNCWSSGCSFPSEDAGARADALVSPRSGRTDDPSLGKRFRDAAESQKALGDGVLEATVLPSVAGRKGQR
jgi:glycosyltransferase involved in cell wall biosynthesis